MLKEDHADIERLHSIENILYHIDPDGKMSPQDREAFADAFCQNWPVIKSSLQWLGKVVPSTTDEAGSIIEIGELVHRAVRRQCPDKELLAKLGF